MELENPDYKGLLEAAFGNLTPVNSIAYLDALRARVKQLNTNALSAEQVQADAVTRGLMVALMSQYFGELSVVNVNEQWFEAFRQAQAAGIIMSEVAQ